MKEYAKSFYQSDAWKKARQTAIKRANGLCERCRAAGRFVPGVIVHHKKYITPAKHAARYRFDGNGNLLPPPGEKERVRPPGGQNFGGDGRTEGDTSKKLRRVARI